MHNIIHYVCRLFVASSSGGGGSDNSSRQIMKINYKKYIYNTTFHHFASTLMGNQTNCDYLAKQVQTETATNT